MSLHADAIAELSAYQPEDDGQAALRTDYLALLAARDDALERSCAPDHLTASALLLDLDRRAVLLTLHAKVKRWLQPGGHCDPGDSTLAGAALREATEESGIDGLTLLPGVLDLDRHTAPCQPGVVDHHLDVRFLVLAPPDSRPVVSEESIDVQWFGWDALPDGIEPTIVRMLAAGRRRLLG